MAHRFTGSASTKRLGSDDSFFLLSTLNKYKIEEISPKRTMELLEESAHLCANAPSRVALRNAQAASEAAYWASYWSFLCCGGYEVDERETECIATWSSGDMTT